MAAGRLLTEPEFMLTLLTNQLHGGAKPVFLLGAGCSQQYGLPGFKELLLALWEDHLHYSGTGRGIEELREGLEKLWQALGPKDRKKILKGHLGGIRGSACPGYLRLAKLAGIGKVKAIVNMNFDTLLEEALAYLEVSHQISTSFRVPVGKTLVVYKPHGTIGEDKDLTHPLSGRAARTANDLILDIAKSDLFSDPEEQEKAQELLTGADVVALGYSGIDAKIDATLLEFPKDGDRRDFKLFIANLTPPDRRLLMAQEERGSRDLSILGEEGGFESFMEDLEKALEKPPGRSLGEKESADPWETPTRAEKTALGQCIKLAQILLSGLAGQEMSGIDLEKHGLAVYSQCRELARLTGIRLTSPEKHVLRCAALLHDLGQLATSRLETGGDNPSWKRLEDHGEITAVLIERRVPRGSVLRENLVPASYGGERRMETVEAILGAILLLCRRHAADSDSAADEAKEEEVLVGNWGVPLRKGLLLAIFAFAEELVEDQPMPRSLEAYLDGLALVENPDHNLSLRWRPGILKISIVRHVFRCEPGDRVEEPIGRFFKARIRSFLARFNKAVKRAGGRCLDVEPSADPHGRKPPRQALRVGALAEAFLKSANQVEPGSLGELPALLDLLAIYTLRAGHGEPWLQIQSDAVKIVLDRVTSFNQTPGRNLLHLYFLAQRKGASTSLENEFIKGFEKIIYPAWRFVARQWRSRTAIIPLAALCLDMGSSRFRAEALEGIPHLLEEHVIRLPDGRAYAHDECTFCTSRLLATFSNARLLFADETLKKLAPSPGMELDQTVAGFLQHFLRRDPGSMAWWGFGGEKTRLRAPDYLAWVARALARCLATDEAIRSRSGEETRWLEDLCGIKRSDLERLLQERWKALLAVRQEDLVSSRVEVTRTRTLGRVAGAYLELETCPTEIRDLALNGGRAEKLIENLERVFKKLAEPTTVERLHLMPVRLILDGVCLDEESARNLVHDYLTSIDSPAWVKEGPDAGSWGFESRHTEQILSSLVAFWRHAFLHHDRFDFAFQEALKNSPPAVTPAG